MGNTPSQSRTQSGGISKPRSLSSAPAPTEIRHTTATGNQSAISRSASARPATTQRVGAPNSHRRTQSALVGNRRNQELPPPPYSFAVSDAVLSTSNPISMSQPQTVARPRRSSESLSSNAGSSHTRVLSISPAGNLATVAEGNADTPPTKAATAEELRRPMRQNSVENALETLRKYNTVIVVDDSISMSGSRWREAREALAALAEVANKYDTDGVDICFLNDPRIGRELTSASLVKRLFDSVTPSGITPIGERLEQLLLFYMDSLERAKALHDAGDLRALKMIKPVNYIVLTDGVPTDDPAEVIVSAARRLDQNHFPLSQLGIQFVQIGNDAQATSFLNELDNDLSQAYGIRDIVDTTPYTGGKLTAEVFIKILLGGINRRVDRRGGQSVL